MIDNRLKTAFGYLPSGCRIADVGTDHAYLPIELIREGIAEEAIAADVNEGPLLRAKKNIVDAGLQEKIKTKLTDGLRGVKEFAPDCVLIFGMGGELIARIIDDAPWVKSEKILLVLQPMSKAALLRRYLNESGFAIVGETLCKEDKIYQTLAVRFQKEPQYLSEAELFFGKEEYRKNDPLYDAFLEHEAAVLKRAADGKRIGSADVSEETNLLEEIAKIRKERTKR